MNINWFSVFSYQFSAIKNCEADNRELITENQI